MCISYFIMLNCMCTILHGLQDSMFYASQITDHSSILDHTSTVARES